MTFKSVDQMVNFEDSQNSDYYLVYYTIVFY